jgi:hypothetical protein
MKNCPKLASAAAGPEARQARFLIESGPIRSAPNCFPLFIITISNREKQSIASDHKMNSWATTERVLKPASPNQLDTPCRTVFLVSHRKRLPTVSPARHKSGGYARPVLCPSVSARVLHESRITSHQSRFSNRHWSIRNASNSFAHITNPFSNRHLSRLFRKRRLAPLSPKPTCAIMAGFLEPKIRTDGPKPCRISN